MKVAKIALVATGSAALLVTALLLVAYAFTYRPPDFVNGSLPLVNRLAIPPIVQPTEQDGKKVFALLLQEGHSEFLLGKKTRTWGVNGTHLGPTIRLRSGDRVQMRIASRLSTFTTMHWHGMELPAVMDGVYQLIAPDGIWEPYWTIENQAATLWYHPHLMHQTGEQVYKGLAGLIIVDDTRSDSLDLPKQYGVDDLPIIVQDKTFDRDGQLVYMHADDPFLGPQGFQGDTILINGTYAPYVEVPRGWVRLRLLNASNARRYNFGFSDDREFYQIASDGGLLEAPVRATRLFLTPGERAEIVVDMRGGGSVTLMSYTLGEEANSRAAMVRLRLNVIALYKSLFGVATDENQQFKLLELRPVAALGKTTPLPHQLNTIPRWSASEAVRTRTFELDDQAAINGKRMDPAYINEVVRKGDVELWEITSPEPGAHTFHVHGVQFLVLDRNGQKPSPSESGWKDNVAIGLGETVRIMMQFKYYDDPNRPYMYHCHILEHEDKGMMGQFVVVDQGTKPEDVFVLEEYVRESKGGTHH